MARPRSPVSESHPEVAQFWMGNAEESDTRTPDDFGIRARLLCRWWCGKEGHSQFTAPPYQFDLGFRCPTCADEVAAEHNRRLRLPVAQVPELVAAWRDPRPYEGLTVNDVAVGVAEMQTGQAYSLRCPNNHKIDSVVRRFLFDGCPYCRGKATRQSSPSIAEADPEIAVTWHPARNGARTPANTPINHSGALWWKSVQCCGYEWQATIAERTLGRRPQRGRGSYYCPQCKSVFGSLAWLDPETASEWHEDNAATPWHLKPTSKQAAMPVRWRCSENPRHVWDASVSARWNGGQCPQCATSGTSRVEKRFLESAQRADPTSTPSSLGGWRVDVLVPSLRLVIEYDGSYWHQDKHDLDRRKTRDLVAAGYLVARVRENDLPHLGGLEDEPRVHQTSFRFDFGSVADTVMDLLSWAAGYRGVEVPVADQPTTLPTSGTSPPLTESGDQPPAPQLWRPPVATTQTCSERSCTETAVFKTRSKPTWCLAHIDEIYRTAGLERLEAFGHPESYVLTRCAACGCEAHYRFSYILDLNARGESTCRACHWAYWAVQYADSAEILGTESATVEAAQARAEQNGFDYIGPCVGLASHRTRCRSCGKISVGRISDMGWSCNSCR